ncbi:Arv1-like family-domain-containing protein [Cantharellus anzutake]|uniref:Arv1-like family-domain-containing protein n=1 Tax=Cantharellus anzutake TaxID=1750568 RepID=UPI001906D041|nr:Arv1-like family-domain-containing protein [Cantharellus anzutake]KAF8336861.1 Arv1-like family-domain-containing protein [Cantharellus anzutake]
MPICTTCTAPIPHLYTVYQSSHNLRLHQCTHCGSFADPYVEHDLTIITLDLILLKPGVYRHLLFNRGSKPKRSDDDDDDEKNDDELLSQTAKDSSESAQELAEIRTWTLLRLAVILTPIDAYIRWSYRYHLPDSRSVSWSPSAANIFFRILVGCIMETLAFHGGVTIASWIVLALLDKWSPHSKSSTRGNLMLKIHVPLVLFYSSLKKLFLLSLLSIWQQSSNLSPVTNTITNPAIPELITNIPWAVSLYTIFDEDVLDREWVIRNLLGGMAAGFGLRVALDCNPYFITLIILFGWIAKTLMAFWLHGWVGDADDERWKVYSIP